MDYSKMAIRAVDMPEMPETFADSIGTVTFDGNTFRVDLCVTRMDKPKEGVKKPTGKQYPACRLVLTPDVSMKLLNHLKNLENILEKQSVVKHATPIMGTVN